MDYVTRAMDALKADGFPDVHFESFVGCIFVQHEGMTILVDDYTGGLPAHPCNQVGWTVGVYPSVDSSDNMIGSASIEGDTSTNAMLECVREALRVIHI